MALTWSQRAQVIIRSDGGEVMLHVMSCLFIGKQPVAASTMLAIDANVASAKRMKPTLPMLSQARPSQAMPDMTVVAAKAGMNLSQRAIFTC